LSTSQAFALTKTRNARPFLVSPDAVVSRVFETDGVVVTQVSRRDSMHIPIYKEVTRQPEHPDPKTEDEVQSFMFFPLAIYSTQSYPCMRLSDLGHFVCLSRVAFFSVFGCLGTPYESYRFAFAGPGLRFELNLFSLYMRGSFVPTLLSTLSEINVPSVLSHLIATYVDDSDP
jgi:hypothetical protein